jgi:predicted AlkP superfamily phosphohydrolase/phosphomutase
MKTKPREKCIAAERGIDKRLFITITIASVIALLVTMIVLTVGGRSIAQDADKKMMVLGIDGMDYKLLRRFIDAGEMPNFAKLAQRGGFRPLTTSIPPQSPVAWSNFITGMNPGGHGIYDFLHRDPNSYFPKFSMSSVEPGPEQVQFAKLTLPNGFRVPLTYYHIPFKGGTTTLLRKGTAFWEILVEEGIPTTMFKLPANFPPVECEARSLSGMGTPDILGTYGTFYYYTTSPPPDADDFSGGKVYKVNLDNWAVKTKIYGPVNEFIDYELMMKKTKTEIPRDEQRAYVDMTVYVDPENPIAKIVLPDEEVVLQEGEFSEWVTLNFQMLPGIFPGNSVSGICRFYLKSVHPEFGLYVSPINIDPEKPALPISTPPEYSRELAEAIGSYYTQGMAEDTKALENGVFDNETFVRQTRIVLEERLKMLDYELDRFDDGLLFFYISTLDQNGHMMWRTMDHLHPAYDAREDSAFAGFYLELYKEMDNILGRVLERLDEETTLIVMSDHGFAPWYRAVNVNTWLYENGYLALKPGTDREDVEWLVGVDWRNTKAYGFGINGLYLNLAGRERYGTVQPGREAEMLMAELVDQLENLVDPKTGQRAVLKVHRSNNVYSGEFEDEAPDLVLGYANGYRGSDETASGELPAELFEDNKKKWSGDHCVDFTVVPGVVLSNRKILNLNPALYDLTPTILEEFGLEKPDNMIGRNVFTQTYSSARMN